jgi:4-carboxymuconolactone decarboxylase
MVSDRYDRGFEKLKEIDGEAGERVIESLKDISPDFARYLIDLQVSQDNNGPKITGATSKKGAAKF